MEDSPALGAADWSELPADILGIVDGKLKFSDLFRSAAVCSSWRSAARSLRRHGLYTRPQTPCLLYSTAAAGSRAVELYSLADKSTYTIPLPDPPIADRTIVGSYHGWLVTADTRSELHLLNPATGEQLALPSVSTIEQVNPVLDEAGNLQRYDLSFYDAEIPRKEYQPPQPFLLEDLRRYLYFKVVLSGDPSRGDCVLMMIYNPYRQLAFSRVGSNKWNWITTSYRSSMYSDCIYHDGAFYAMNRQGGIHRYTIKGSCATREVIFKDTSPFTPAHKMYIARTSSGDVLQIWRETSSPIEDSLETQTTDIEIFKVDFGKQDILDIDTLKNDALFVGHNYSCCLSIIEHPGLLSNHVYFTDDEEYSLIDDQDYRRDVGMYNLGDNSVFEIVSPQPWLNWPVPVWITPSFTKINNK
ncbi:hypothetical protein HU200_030847 [Digitaria exilis]|uniref:F-box domain-containing protein n=1 Tax=Digitaria exilis TaxID=1010633 RepID=A0A835BR59_9POAL|nr:hypothetical protein HU200_030847 [Digitaria exilis]